MGHREQLLEGAKRCLYERGYARTTARDIVAASGTNLASIGYHFGSKEALLDAALIDAIGEMTDRLLKASTVGGDLPGGLAVAWDRVIDEFATYRPLLIAHVEAWAQLTRSEPLRERFAEFYQRELERGADHVRSLRPGLDEPTAQAISAVTGLLSDGLLVQWLIDPGRIPSGQVIAAGLRAAADVFDPGDEPRHS